MSTTSTTLVGVENLQFYATANAATINLGSTTGVESILMSNNAGNATVSGINSTIQTISVTGNPTVGADDTNTFTVTGLAASASVNLNVNGVGDTNATLNTDNDTITIDPTSGLGFATVNIATTGTASFITLDDGAATNLTTINATGSSALVLELTPTTVTTVNAAAMTGAFSVTVGAGTLNITGGTGGDNINMAGTYTSADTINGGSGTDTLWLTTAEAVVTTAQTKVTNIEKLRITNELEGTIDLAQFSATGVVLTVDGHAADAVITYAAGTGTLEYGVTDQEETTLVVNGNLASGSDILNITYGSTTAAMADGGTLVANNIETINVLIQGAAVTANDAITLAPVPGTTVNVSGSFGGGLGTITATTINASGVALSGVTATGVTLTAGAAASVTGSNGIDTLTGSSSADVIRGGSGADVIVGALGNDVLNGGLGADNMGSVADAGTVGSSAAVTFTTSAADSFILAANAVTSADTIRLDDVAADNAYTFTINTGVVATTVVATAVVSLGTTTVTAFGYVLGAAATTAQTADAVLYQDTNGNGVIDVNEFAVSLDASFGAAAGAETFAVTIVGGAAVVTVTAGEA